MATFKIGDPVEVGKRELVDGPAGWEECPTIRTVWLPATVCGLSRSSWLMRITAARRFRGMLRSAPPDPAQPQTEDDIGEHLFNSWFAMLRGQAGSANQSRKGVA